MSAAPYVCNCRQCKQHRREEFVRLKLEGVKQLPPSVLCKEYVLEKQFNVRRANGGFV